jgi:hypothetical protein
MRYIEEGQTIPLSKEKEQNDKQKSTKHYAQPGPDLGQMRPCAS